ncbi:MAG: SDR family oxidoreductase [Burkholderiales bacterium]|nr:SDR family oxidoreductase [Burkholderiales bacterium]
MRLKDKVAVVTGGGSGIGKAIAMRFADEGATVIVASRTLELLRRTAEEITARGCRARAVQTDIGDETQVRRMAALVVEEFGRIDILVNNSAAMLPQEVDVADMSLGHWNAVVEVNLTGTMLCSREALKSMIPRRSGSIVNISSMAGVIGNPRRSAYSASKWGMLGLAETMAIEAGPYDIRVNSVSPAATATERFASSVKARAERLGHSYEEQMQKILAHYSLKRLAQPSEVAAAALFLASDEASGITGQNLIVSCGFHMLNPSEIA